MAGEEPRPNLVDMKVLRMPHNSSEVKKKKNVPPWNGSGTVAIQEEVLSPCRSGT